MSTTRGHQPTIDLDHHSEEFSRSGIDIEKEMRSGCPIAWSPHHGGFWVVTTHEGMSTSLRDVESFSSHKDILPDGGAVGGLLIPPAGSFRNIPDETDPPEWNIYRRLLNPAFAPSAIDRLRPRILELTTEVIDSFIERGTVDLVMDLASPVTAMITLEMLGLELDDWEMYASPIHRISYEATEPDVEVGMAACRVRILESIAAYREEPDGRLIAQLAEARPEGKPIDDETIADVVVQILLGGFDTTSALLGSALVYLDEHREHHARLLVDERYMRLATEEFLRWASPIIGLARTAVKPTEIHGCPVEPGDRVWFSYRSANRDESMFDDADAVVLDRFPNRHIAFGVGIHRCLGSNLARAVFQTVLRETLRRLPDYQVDRSAARRLPRLSTANGWITIPATFTPGRKGG